MAAGRQALIGVSAFPRLGDDGVTAEPWPRPLPARDLNGERAMALIATRLAEPFEVLRDAADAYASRTGARASIFLVRLGPIAQSQARAVWTENFLAAGGIGVNASGALTSSTEAGAAFADSGASVACLCASDDVYAELGEATVSLLKTAGAKAVCLAGRPANLAELEAAGVGPVIAAGCDAPAVLSQLHEILGIPSPA
jgi:methylmalonyl-CoA mutase